MPSTDFGSNNRSPGGWGGSGSAATGGQGGMGGAKSSAGNYNYRTGVPRADNFRPGQPINGNIGNWNTGGVSVGFGNQYGVNQNNGIKRGYPGTAGPTNRYIAQVPLPPPVVQPPAVDPVVASLARRLPLSAYSGPGPGQFFDLTKYDETPGYTNPPRSFPGNPDPPGVGGKFGKDQSRLPGGGGPTYRGASAGGGGAGWGTNGGPRGNNSGRGW